MTTCRECHGNVSEQAVFCPHCGAPRPALVAWDGRGFEYKSGAAIAGIPLLHVSFRYRLNGTPVVARGIIAIGQFGFGIVNISQFGIGVFSVSQFTVSVLAVAQFAFAYSLVAQIGVYIHEGYGQMVWRLAGLM